MKKIWLACVGLMMLLIPGMAIQGSSIQMEIEPARFEIPLTPNRTTTGAIVIKNKSGQAVQISAMTCDWEMDEYGNPDFAEPSSRSDSCAGWITFNPRRFRIEGGKQQVVRFGITPPAAAKTGEYRSAIRFGTQPLITNENATLISGNIMVTIYAVLPEVERDGRIARAEAGYAADSKIISSVLEVESLGTAHIRFTPSFQVKSADGRIVAAGNYDGGVVFDGQKRILHGYCLSELAPGQYTVESVLQFQDPFYIDRNKQQLPEYPPGVSQLNAAAGFTVNKGD